MAIGGVPPRHIGLTTYKILLMRAPKKGVLSNCTRSKCTFVYILMPAIGSKSKAHRENSIVMGDETVASGISQSLLAQKPSNSRQCPCFG